MIRQQVRNTTGTLKRFTVDCKIHLALYQRIYIASPSIKIASISNN